jgi:hypothetical protein
MKLSQMQMKRKQSHDIHMINGSHTGFPRNTKVLYNSVLKTAKFCLTSQVVMMSTDIMRYCVS